MTRKQTVLVRVSSLAIAAALTASAAAQSFLGDPTVTFGSVNIIEGPSTTDLSVESPTAVIDWTPDDNAAGNFGAIAFQNNGTTANFSSASDFAVLNRINIADPGRVVAMNGAINSLVDGVPGHGSIFFYSPSGFVIGSSAVINVGSLVLSASPIAVDANGGFINGTTVTFNQAVNPSAAITTVAGSQINALNQGSYVALVAPRVEHHGAINVNGAAALVGAEAATINFRAGGLFDIQVDIGTTDANGVDVDGTITGPASTGASDIHRAYLVAVPKNTALTLLIGSGANLGFEIAGAADVVGNAVVLSAGHDVGFGDTSFDPSAASGADADISIGNANFTSALYGRANGDAVASSVAGSLTFASDVSLRGRDLAKLEVGGDGDVSVGGNLTLSANASGSTEGASATAGNVTLQAFAGGTIAVTGNTDLTAVGTGGFSSTEGLASGDGTGGTILVQATTGGDMSLGGSLNADATGRGGSTDNFGVDGGDGFGGTVSVFASGGGTLGVSGATQLTADGQAGPPGGDCIQCRGVGGIGDAGTINVQAHSGPGSSMTFGNVLYLRASGYGGDGQTGDGGAGLGGNINFSAGDGSSVTVASDVSLQAEGYAGSAFGGVGDGGAGQGGNIQAFAVDGGTLGLTAGLQEYVGGYGGSAEAGTGGLGQGGLGQLFTLGSIVTVGGYATINANGNGGDGLVAGAEGRGGTAYFSTADGGSLSITGFASLSANGRGGRGYGADGAGGNGGGGHGGHVEAFANNGAALTFGSDLYLNADGEGGSAGDIGTSAGDGFGGDVYLQAVSGGSVGVTQGLYANAEGLGGSGNFGVYSGNGTGGTITVISRDGTSSLTVTGAANLEADGYAGYSSECSQCSAGGFGQGGDIFIASTGVLTGSTLEFQSTLSASANGYGGESAIIDFDANTTVDGGDGFGGTVSLYANGGNSLNVAGEVTLEAIGFGGYDSAGLIAGDGIGGTAQVMSLGTTANLMAFGGGVFLDARGVGGDTGLSLSGTGGDGTGGVARLENRAGAITIAGDFTARGEGHGGDSDGPAGIGGDGFGKTAEIFNDGGDTTIGGSAFISASGYGGEGFVAGNGTGGGDSVLRVDGAHILSRNGDIRIGFDGVETSVNVESNGYGGAGIFSGSAGGSGGDGTGGWVTVHAANSDLGPSSIAAPIVVLSATGEGGAGGEGGGGTNGSPGGNGGTGTGGTVILTAAAGNGLLEINDAFVTVEGFGGDGGDGGSADGGIAGNGGNGGAAFGGFANVGTESGAPSIAQAGIATFNSITVNASATGGQGGNGGIFGAPNGNGGNGGSAEGGTAVLIVRGSTVNVNSVGLIANATGGDGGSGVLAGAGGDAESDEIGVIVTERSGSATRGQLNAGAITGTVNAVGGSGSTAGLSLAEGGSSFIVQNSDAEIGSVDIAISADGTIADLATDMIAIINGDVVIDGGFTFLSPGLVSVYADSGTLRAASIDISANSFVHDPDRPFPGAVGTFGADAFNLQTDGDLIIDAHLESTNSLDLIAPGLIDIEDATSGFDLTLDAGGSISGGSMTAAGLIDANAGSDIGLNLVIAGSTITMQSTAGSIFANGLSAGGLVDLHANVDVSTGDITGDSINVLADSGGISVGDLLAQTSVDLNAPGAINIGGIVDAGTNVSINSSLNAIAAGAVDAGGDIFLGSLTGTTAGNLTAGGSVDAQSGGSIVTADITAVSGDVTASAALIDVGNVSAGGFISLSADTILGDNMTAGGFIDLFAGGPATIIVGDLSGAGVYATSIGDITTGTIDSSLDVDLLSFNGSITTSDVTAATNITADAAGLLTMDNLTGQTIDLSAGTGIAAGDVNATELLATTLNGDMSFGDIATLLGLSLNAQGSILTGLITTGDFVTLQAGGTIGTGNIDATTDVTLNASGAVTTGDITAGGLIDATGTSLILGNLNANSIDLTTTVADLTVGSVTIPGSLALTTAGDLVLGNLSAFDVDVSATLSMTGGNIDSATDVTALAGTSMSLGNLVAGGNVSAAAGSLALGDISGSSLALTSNAGDVSTGDLIAFSSLAVDSAADFLFGSIVAPLVDLAAPGSIIGGAITSDADITAVAGADVDVGDLSAGGFDGEVFQFGDISLTAGGDISTGLVFAAGSVTADATGSVTTLNIDAFDAVGLTAGTSIATGDVNANSVNMLAGTDIGVGDITAFGSVLLDAGGSLAFGDINGFVVDLLAGGSIDGGNIDSETDIIAVAGGDIDLLALTAGGTTGEGFFEGSVDLTAGGSVNSGVIDAFGHVGISAGGGIMTGAIDAADFVQLGAVADIATGDIGAGDFINIFTDGGIATGNLTGTIIDLDAFGDVTFGNVLADDFDFETDGDVTGGNIIASQHVGGETLGAVVLGDISVGPGLPPTDDFSVGIAGATSVTVGDVSGAGRVGLATFGDLTTGNIVAGDLFIALAGGDASTGSVTTAAGGGVYMADGSMYDIGTGGGQFDFDYRLVVGLDPVPTGRSITIGGPASTGLFQAAAGGDLTTQAITANRIDASAGGTAAINGLWQSPDVELWSNDIDIAANGGIDAGNNGLIRLVSTNATQALIGDGIAGTGYALTNAEFGRLSAGNVQIAARGDASAAIDMLIGDLSITGPLAGSTIDDPLGSVVFATGDPATEVAGGVIRIVGDVIATGFTADNVLEFTTGRFELDAATGSINILGSGTGLAGELFIEADRIHVASGTILDQLAADPHYAGYEDDLNAPAEVQRPDGVIRAGLIAVAPTEAILVQNTGTEDQRAGFTANFVDLVTPEGAAPGSIELIVNGQLLGQAGTLFGVEVRDAIVLGLNLAPFTGNSMINGCLLTGACGVIEPPEPPEPPFPPGFTATPGIQDEFVLLDDDVLPPPEFDNENFIDDNDPTTLEGETSPIEPPQPLFDTSGLGDKGDVDDPVSGSGNPALMETIPPASNQEKQP